MLHGHMAQQKLETFKIVWNFETGCEMKLNVCSINTSPPDHLDNFISSRSVVPVPHMPVLPHCTRSQGGPEDALWMQESPFSLHCSSHISKPHPSLHLSKEGKGEEGGGGAEKERQNLPPKKQITWRVYSSYRLRLRLPD